MRRFMHFRFLTIGLLAAGLAFAQAAPARAECAVDSTEGVLGGLAGAALGGFLGSKIGSGSGKTAATIGGALLGGFAGNQAARNLTCQDQSYMYDTTQSSLERYPSGQSATWRNPDSGHWGTVTPVSTYQGEGGRNCREFEQTIYIDGQPEQATGTACRQGDGTWKIIGG